MKGGGRRRVVGVGVKGGEWRRGAGGEGGAVKLHSFHGHTSLYHSTGSLGLLNAERTVST